MKKNKLLYIALIIIGTLVIIYPIIGKILNQKSQSDVIYKYKKTIQDMNDEEIKNQKEKYQIYNNDINQNKSSHIDLLTGGKILGYIKIEAINIFLPIYEGTEEKVLYKGIGHLENTSLPVTKGDYHSIFVGHSGLTSKKLFDDLEKLKVGEKFTITILDETYKYKIYKIKKVLPNQTKDLSIKKGKKLVTLVTCTPKYINSHGLLIMGNLDNV